MSICRVVAPHLVSYELKTTIVSCLFPSPKGKGNKDTLIAITHYSSLLIHKIHKIQDSRKKSLHPSAFIPHPLVSAFEHQHQVSQEYQ